MDEAEFGAGGSGVCVFMDLNHSCGPGYLLTRLSIRILQKAWWAGGKKEYMAKWVLSDLGETFESDAEVQK